MLRLVTEEFTTPAECMVAQTRELATLIEAGRVEHGMIVAVVDGAVCYAPLGTVTLVEATGMLTLASRKVERDLL